jgi:hypothetical protein
MPLRALSQHACGCPIPGTVAVPAAATRPIAHTPGSPNDVGHIPSALATALSQPTPRPGEQTVKRSTAELAAAESMHWQHEHDLADAAAGLEAAADWYGSIVSGLGARRDKVTAEHRVAATRAQQRVVVQAAAASRQRLEEARRGQ